MKLHFYFLEDRKRKIRYEECEVIEKPKTYYPAKRFPHGIYTSFIKKDEIDRTIYSYGVTYIILTENNFERAAEAFTDYCNYEIRCKEDRIREANYRIKMMKEMIDMIERWRNTESEG